MSDRALIRAAEQNRSSAFASSLAEQARLPAVEPLNSLLAARQNYDTDSTYDKE
ncbi:MAG: hypothetical protein KKB32_09080 [Acidobacteria bacterium]|nr:hypothetical protein [Acidobacteriota bacterium]